MNVIDWSTKFFTVLRMADQLMLDGNEKLDLSDKAVWDLASRVGSEIEYYLTMASLSSFGGDIDARTLSKWIERGFTLGLEPEWSGPQMMSAFASYLVSDARQRLHDLPPPFEILGEVDEDETMDCRALQKWIYGEGIWRRDEIIAHCAGNIFEAMEACHYGRLLIDKSITPDMEWLAEFARKVTSDKARHSSSGRWQMKHETAWKAHCTRVMKLGHKIERLDDLQQIEGYDPEMMKIKAATLRKWAREAGVTFKPGRPKEN